jgi:tetratricopeptide (TPR) repeat protein
MINLREKFTGLTRSQILAIRPGAYGDYELLDAIGAFDEDEQMDCQSAVYELILRSPEVSELVDYEGVFAEVIDTCRAMEEFAPFLRWMYGLVAFAEQHTAGENRASYQRRLAKACLANGYLEDGLRMYTSLLQVDAGNFHNYYAMGMALYEADLDSLAVEALDRALALPATEDDPDFKARAEALRKQANAAARQAPDRSNEISPAVLAEWRAIMAQPILPPDPEAPDPYPPLIARLIAGGPDPDPALWEAILAQGRALIPALIRLAFDTSEAAQHGADQAVDLLRKMLAAYPDEMSLLADWLAQAHGDWRTGLLDETTGKIGGYTTEALEAIAADVGYATMVRNSALESLQKRVARLPEQRPALIEFLRALLTRSESRQASEEEFNAWVIDTALEIDARELHPEIRRIYDEDCLEPGIVNLEDIHDEWGLEPLPSRPALGPDGMRLPLMCKDCGRTREHFVEHVLIDVPSLEQEESGETLAYSPFIMDHDIVCKCGAVNRYDLTAIAHLRMAGPEQFGALLGLSEKKKPKLKANPRVLYFSSSAFGKLMHPLEAVDEYRRLIAAQPRQVELYLRFGNLLRMTLRYSQALEAYHKALDLAPNDPEVVLTVAIAEHDIGDTEAARQHYQQILDQQMPRRGGAFHMPDDIAVNALQLLHALERGRPSLSDIHVNLQDGRKVLHPSLTFKWGAPKANAQLSDRSAEKAKPRHRRRKR